MKNTPISVPDLKVELDKFLSNICATQSLLYQSKTYLTYLKKNVLEKKQDGSPKRTALGSRIVMGDLTGPADKGWKINYPTGFSVIVKWDEVEESIDTLIKRDGMRSLATCYEILESFFWNITVLYIQLNPGSIIKANKIRDHNKFNGVLREQLRYYYNNDDIIKLIGQLSRAFKNAQTENTPNLKLKDWYRVLTEVRHSIIHSLFELDLDKANFNNDQEKIFKDDFECTVVNGKAILELEYSSSNDQIIMIAEYGFLIFKCFCIEMKQDWKVLSNM